MQHFVKYSTKYKNKNNSVFLFHPEPFLAIGELGKYVGSPSPLVVPKLRVQPILRRIKLSVFICSYFMCTSLPA